MKLLTPTLPASRYLAASILDSCLTHDLLMIIKNVIDIKNSGSVGRYCKQFINSLQVESIKKYTKRIFMVKSTINSLPNNQWIIDHEPSTRECRTANIESCEADAGAELAWGVEWKLLTCYEPPATEMKLVRSLNRNVFDLWRLVGLLVYRGKFIVELLLLRLLFICQRQWGS